MNIADSEGNTAAHLSVLKDAASSDSPHHHQPPEASYTNDLEAVFDPMHIARLTQMEIPSGTPTS